MPGSEGSPLRPGIVLLITHDEGGGTERFVQERAAVLVAAGQTCWFLRPDAFGGPARLERPGETPLLFEHGRDHAALLALLRRSVTQVEVHHLRSHAPGFKALPLELGLPIYVFVHDWALICPRGTLVRPEGGFCGEASPEACKSCVSDYAMMPVVAPGGVAALRQDWAALLRAAERVVVATRDGARRIRRHFPGAEPVIEKWEEAPPPPMPPEHSPWPRICVAGRLARYKGFEVLRDCAADAAARNLPMDFVLVGRSMDDAALRATGRCAVTGEYAEGAGEAWVRAQRAAIGFIPSIWPETWCYAQTVLSSAGLPIAAFALGAQGERVAASGGLALPLGLPPGRINDLFLARMAGLTVPSQRERQPLHA
ncbi:glycosyltransferase family protein [Sabulicella rubraurantiaca]|uniref:hypothetical protein n=1 Tax=Sabulicella rubraurantiaca TaxID=2811429 RepID=UPI001A979658|nr:hypothetical protein [Sabulicella rubraurantiaca]